MARPVDPEKRRALAKRAVEVLEREGLSIPAARLAEALGIKRPTLLYYFPVTTDILELAMEELLREQMAFVMEQVEAHEHPIDRLDAQLRAIHAFHHGREARLLFLTQAIAASAGSHVSRFVAIGNEVFRARREEAVRRLREGIAAGLVAPCDPEAVVGLVRALSDGLILQRVMTGVELGPLHDLAYNALLAPLRRPARPKPARRTASTNARPRSSRKELSS